MKTNAEYGSLRVNPADFGYADIDEGKLLRQRVFQLHDFIASDDEALRPLGKRDPLISDFQSKTVDKFSARSAPRVLCSGLVTKAPQLRLPTRRPPEVEVTVENHHYFHRSR